MNCTDDDEGFIGEDFTVARVKRRVLQQSYIGAIYTRRDAPDDTIDASHTLGIDVRLATARFLGSQNLEATGWMLHANRPVCAAGTTRSVRSSATPTIDGTCELIFERSSRTSIQRSAS